MAHSERRWSLAISLGVTSALALALAPAACSKKDATDSTYFDRTIAPVLTTSCVRTNTGAACHVSDPKGNAFGNLDTSTFAGVNHRRDLLVDYGPYGQPAFLVKNIPPFNVDVQTFDGQKVAITTDIKHAGGPIFDPTASGYQILRRWIENGATENNTGAPPSNVLRLPCPTFIPTGGGGAQGFDPNVDPPRQDFGTFRDRVNPVFKGTCAAGNCHGNSSNELYLTCGDSPEQVRWNYFMASQYLAQTPEQAELTRRPLAPALGGSYHEGGIIFASTTDDGYQGLIAWAKEHGPPDFGAIDPNFAFFAHKVQPMLVKKGCMMLQCHAAAQFHDYKLRGGAGGSFSFSATKKNYQLSLDQLSLESEDVNASRIVRKNLFRPELAQGSPGITHRGGPLLEDFHGDLATGARCDGGGGGGGGGDGGAEGGAPPDAGAPSGGGPYDYDNGDIDKIPAYCIIREWHRRERAARNLAPLSAIVYVKRVTPPPGKDRAQDFDVYAPGADLRLASATLAADGTPQITGDKSVTAGCALDPASADIRRPAVSWDGKRIAFAARTSVGEPLQIYEMNADGTSCAKHGEVNAGPASQNGLLVHNFDPAYSPPDASGGVHLVFASTRGNLMNPGPYDYSGPQRTPADPSKPNANLYVFEPDPTKAGSNRVRQLTYLLDMEREPSFMQDGRVVFTTEKRAPGFYQLALRRQNIDGGDYHPLYAQRGSIGYHEATQVVELADKTFAAIFSEPGAAHQGGALGVFNRSIGVDFTSPTPGDYLVDPSVIDPAAPSSPEPSFFLHSLKFPDFTVSGRPKAPTSGIYTSPATLPGGKVLVSFGATNDVGTFNGDYDVYVLDPATGQKAKVLGDAGSSETEAVAVYARADHGLFHSIPDEPNAHTQIHDNAAEADIHVLDMRVLGTLLFQNTPTGRPIESTLGDFEVYEDMPPPIDMTTLAPGGNVAQDEFGLVFVKRRLLGKVPVASDGSSHFQIPGGLPIVLKLPDTQDSQGKKLPRFQREEMQFSPGEYANQSFRQEFFDGLCAQCHGSVSGRPTDVAVRPDFLTQASATLSRDAPPANLNVAPPGRGQPIGP